MTHKWRVVRPSASWVGTNSGNSQNGSGGLPKAFPPSVLPEVPEARWRKLSVANRVLDVLVPEVVLERARVVAVIGEFEPAGMAQHVRMHVEGHLRGLPEPGNHPAEADRAHGRSPLAHE